MNVLKTTLLTGLAALILLTPVPARADGLVRGMVHTIYALPEGFDLSSGSELPPAELGFFRAAQSEFTFEHFTKELEIPLQGAFLWRSKGFLEVKAPGTYVFSLSLQDYRAYGMILVNGEVIAGNWADGQVTPYAPYDFTSPGVYPVEFRVAAEVNKELRSTGGTSNPHFKYRIRIPGAGKPVPAHTALSIEKP